MATSGQVVGQDAFITLEDSGSNARAVRGDTNSISLSWTADTPENTTFGATTRTRLPGLKDWTLEYSGFFNDTADTGIDTVLASILGERTHFVFGPAGSTAEYRQYSGSGIISDYSIDTPVDGMVAVSWTLVAATGSLFSGSFNA